MPRKKATVVDSLGWGLTKGQRKEIDDTRDLYRNNFELFCKSELHIIDRDSPTGASVRLFKWNQAQHKLNRTIDLIKLYNLRRTKELHAKDPRAPVSEYPVQVVILKPRKVGISTYLQARSIWRAEFEANITCLIMAHELGAARNIASISKRYLDLWKPLKNDYRKEIHKCTDNGITWGTDPVVGKEWGSKIIVATGGMANKGTSRSFTYHFVHISEEAHFRSESEVAAALSATVPFKETYEESTANGIGGMFYDNYKNAADIESVLRGEIPAGWNGKFRFFFGWLEDPSYRLAITDNEREHITKSLSPRESQLMDQFGADLEQLAWRRYKIGSECSAQSEMDPEDYFNQEYPTEPDDAFVSTGSNAFYLRGLTKMHTQNRNDPFIAWQGHLTAMEGGECHKMQTNYQPSCILYRDPVPGGQYVMGIDTAEGLQHGDDSVISVWHRKGAEYMEEVARVINKAAPDELASMAVFLARLYNDAFIVPESNNAGGALCLHIHRSGYPYMYIRENPEKIAEQDKNHSFMYGFHTGTRTKPLLVSAGQQACREGKILIRNKTALRQWEIYKNADGRYMAPEGEKDDCVMADLLAIWAHFSHTAPLARKFSEEERKKVGNSTHELDAETHALWERMRKVKKEYADLQKRRRVVRTDAILGRFF